jgi:hypothetical protein
MSQLQVTGEAKIRDIQGPVVANSGVVTALDGAASQYVRGDGTLADFPTSTGGGSSVSYYLNSSVSQGTIGGVAYRELSKEPIIGAGTDIAIAANGYVANYLTDANDPDVLSIPGGNFNCEFYFSVNNNTGNPTTYAELYKYDGTTFTLLGTSAGVPESINQGTTIAPYYFAIPVATAALSVTDRLAIRIYVNVDGRTVTLHTENGHLCQVVTTLSKGMVSLNNLTDQSQYLATGTSGTNFAIVSSGDTHTFNLPVASATNTGKLSSTDWSTFNGKVPYTGAIANVDLGLFSLTSNIVKVLGDNSTYGGTLSIRQSNVTNLIGVGYTELFGKTNILGISFGVGSIASLSNSVLTAARTYNLPDLSGTLALLEGTQTFSGAKTFSLDILVNGLTIGRGAGSIATNTAIGISALAANTTGIRNIAIGENALLSNTTGFNNIAIGPNSLSLNSTGLSNVAIGNRSLENSTGGGGNTAIGSLSLSGITTGQGNIAIGLSAGFIITTGSNNTIIGAYAGTTTLSNNIVLADGAGNVRYRYDGTNNNLYGNVNFNSTIGNGTYTYTLPSATGTLALTSNLSAYLPLTGGTLTGALSGTSATFSGDFGVGTATPSVYTNLNTITINGTNGSVIDFKTGEVLYGELFCLANELRVDAVGASGVLKLLTNSVPRLTIASSGAATFSSSIALSASSGFPAVGLLNRSSDNNLYMVAASSGFVLLDNSQNTMYNATPTSHTWQISNSPKMTLNSSGNVGIGTTTINDYSIGSSAKVLQITGSSYGIVNANAGSVTAWLIADTAEAATGTSSNHPFKITTNNTERMRITSGGDLLVGDTSGFGYKMRVKNAASVPYGISMVYTQSPNVTGDNQFIICADGTNDKFIVWSSGSVVNRTGSYAAISDVTLKENIIDATPKLDKLLQLKVRNFNFIGEDLKQLGFVAQEMEQVFPNMVDTDKEGLKSVKTTILIPMLVKAIQEQTQIIKDLEARIVSLESK